MGRPAYLTTCGGEAKAPATGPQEHANKTAYSKDDNNAEQLSNSPLAKCREASLNLRAPFVSIFEVSGVPEASITSDR